MRKSPSKKNLSRATLETGQAESKLGHHAYQHLKWKLLNGELCAGDRISEVRLAADLGMSRTPVREAIRRLEMEGVLHCVASSGTFVKQAERSTIVEVYELRIAIECFAVRKAARRMKSAGMRQLREFCDGMLSAIRDFRDSGKPFLEGDSLRRYLNADVGFHLLLLEAAENQRAMTIYTDLNVRSAVFGLRSHERDLHHVARVWLQHARVARAVRRRDAQAALQALEAHMHASMEAALEAYDMHMKGAAAKAPDSGDTMAELLAGITRGAA